MEGKVDMYTNKIEKNAAVRKEVDLAVKKFLEKGGQIKKKAPGKHVKTFNQCHSSSRFSKGAKSFTLKSEGYYFR